MNTEEYIKFEVERQGSTKFVDFSIAVQYASLGPSFELGESLDIPMAKTFENFVMTIAELVEPELNDMSMAAALKGEGNLRKTPVSFATGGTAASPADVPHQFHRWAVTWTEGILRPQEQPTEEEVDWSIKSLLQIHPWVDGNGRTASILRNWMLGTLDNPTALPYFFGGS